MTRYVIGLVVSVFVWLQSPAPTFRASTRLIVQTVSVKDKAGRPIDTLTAADFVVTEDGKAQDIAFAEYQRLDDAATPTMPAAAASVERPEAALPLQNDAKYRGRRLVVLYFDTSKMPLFDRIRAFAGADAYVATAMAPADLIAVMVFQGSGVRTLQEFTNDRAALRRVLQDLMASADPTSGAVGDTSDPGGAFGEDDATFNLFTTDRQLAALQTTVTQLGALQEMKTLVYFGSGLRLNGGDNQAQLRATVNAAVRANVTLNPIDARGLVATAPIGDATRASPGGSGVFTGALAQTAALRVQQAQDTLYALAKDTGGRAMFDNNDLALGIAQAARSVTGYYMIGYYSRNTAADGRFRRVKVTVSDRLSADLSYRQGYYADKNFSQFTSADKERQLEDALKLDDPITDIPMAMEVNYFQLNRAEYFVPISVRLPGSELTRPRASGTTRVVIDMIGEIKDEHGVTYQNVKDKLEVALGAAAASQVASRPIQYETGVTLLPGTYVIKLLARDATTGRIGTFLSSFTIPNLERETTRLPTSSVVLTSQRVAPGDVLYSVKQKISAEQVNPLVYAGQKLIPSVTRAFGVSRPLFVFLQAYERDASAMRPLLAFVTLFRQGVKAFETKPLVITEGWDAKSKAVPVRFSISLSELTPGPYDCQVTVLDPATARASFWRGGITVVR